jgi:membrane protein implicated in regulation of membrane protease activity
MGANATQAYGVALFLIAFALLAAAFAGGGILLSVLGLATLAGSIRMFVKAKPWEQLEG